MPVVDKAQQHQNLAGFNFWHKGIDGLRVNAINYLVVKETISPLSCDEEH